MSESRPSEAETCVPQNPEESDTTDAPETIDWAVAWSRGTLGSLGRFQLRERLGDGGFGQVYLAYDPRLDRDVALKVLKLPDPNARVMERFFREARAVARLDHPNIVAVHDAGFDDGRCWVAYQLVGGRPLWWYRDRQRMDPITAARMIRDLADAVSHAHGMGVVHRDIKPGNVIIDDRGRPRLIDFGLARRSDVESDLTRDGVVVGTPAYMSPEQAIGLSSQADERSDVYSLGVIFYELLCGRRPQDLWAEAGETGETVSGPPRVQKPSPGVRTINPAVPRPLDAICARAMSPQPSDRYPSARVLSEAIDRWLSRRRWTRLRVAMGILAFVGFVGLAVAAVSVPRLTPANRAAVARKDPVEPLVAASVPSPLPLSSPTNPAGSGAKAGRSRAAGTQLPTGQLFASSRRSSAKKYHVVPCGAAKTIGDENLILLSTPEEARQRGYQPCERCKPPQAKTEPQSIPEEGGDAP